MSYQEFFNHMHDEHDLTLLESEMQEIERIILKINGVEPNGIVKGGYAYKDVIDYLNEVTGSEFKYAKSHKRIIEARLKEKYSFEDFKSVIDTKSAQWKGGSMQMYLRPSTLFQASKMDGYLQESKRQVLKNTGDSNFTFKPTDTPELK